MSDIETKLIEGIREITGRDVAWDEDLNAGAVDSLTLVEVINFVESLGQEAGVTVDFDRLINEDVMSLAVIHSVLKK